MDGDRTIHFDESVNRIGTNSVKWDMSEKMFGVTDVLPMWVADMDFTPPDTVIEAIKSRLEHGIFGYSFPNDSLFESIQNWLLKRHNWSIRKDSILFSPGVVPALGMAIQAYTNVGDKVLIQTPVYTPFFDMVTSLDRKLVCAELMNHQGRYEIDFSDFEEKLKEGVSLFLLCSPHNPGGRVWTKDELAKIVELCERYDVPIASDEIHSDLIIGNIPHTPTVKMSRKEDPKIITCLAPSKTFNIAGIQSSAMIIPNEEMRDRMAVIQKRMGFFALNLFGMVGMEAAYNGGEEWLDELLIYLKGNIELTENFIKKELPDLGVMKPDGGYLLWIDYSRTGYTEEQAVERLLHKGRLALEPGSKYGESGRGFLRMNIASPRPMVLEGLQRLKNAFTDPDWKKEN